MPLFSHLRYVLLRYLYLIKNAQSLHFLPSGPLSCALTIGLSDSIGLQTGISLPDQSLSGLGVSSDGWSSKSNRVFILLSPLWQVRILPHILRTEELLHFL